MAETGPESGDLIRLVEHGDAMGATFSVVLYGRERAEMDAAIDAAFAEVARLDALLSNYRAESEWSEVNRRAAGWAGAGFAGALSVAVEVHGISAARAKGPSILRWGR